MKIELSGHYRSAAPEYRRRMWRPPSSQPITTTTRTSNFFFPPFFLSFSVHLSFNSYIYIFFFLCVGGREGGTSILFLCFVLSGFLRVFLSVSFLSCCWKGPPLILGSSKTSEEGSKQEAGVLLAIERFSAVIIAGTVIRKRFELSTRRDQSLRSLRNSSSGILSLSLSPSSSSPPCRDSFPVEIPS